MTERRIQLIIVEPIRLKLTAQPVYTIGTAQAGPRGVQGEQGEAGPQWTGATGAKSSATDEGTLWDMSIDDDYLYICVKTGTVGNAIWKKTVLFQT